MHQLGLVETRRRTAEMFRPEMSRHVCQGQPAVDVARVAQTEQVVEDCSRKESALAKLSSAGTAVPLRQRCAVRPHQ